MSEEQLSPAIEELLVARNPRGMASIRNVLPAGYYARAARVLNTVRGTVLIGTGFPVLDTFETDGPVGAIALYQTLQAIGAHPVLVCGPPLSRVLKQNYRVHEIAVGGRNSRQAEASAALQLWQPEAIVSIERPGLSARGHYSNIRGEDISERCACFDDFLNQASCPTIAIGDGGNEIGMGNVHEHLLNFDIEPTITCCDELLVADVSNWGALGLIAIIGYWQGQDLLGTLSTRNTLAYLSAHGSVDGVTRQNTLTEDGLPVETGESVLLQLRKMTGFGDLL
ncbi:DUF4392 domain-containing protein [Halieaceae bacterium IMCC14734]|uniref:DUF4392 domain-containing protein n=1 Tax=Candidatus Litorirhabdus singularis TaxID=2518993 RepID=A0ABT3TFI0_9GAMM|nr:DUF4392 domain-containing protein [Candidatus Litorirhabdus singularis]